MRKSLLALAVTGAVLATGSAFALSNAAGTYYMPLEFGMYHTDATRDMNNTGFGSIGIGYNVNSIFAVQANAGYADPDSDSGSGQSYNAYLFDVEGKLSMPTQTSIMPYALLGAGYMELVSHNMMVDGGVGLAYALGPDLNANATYRMAYQYGQGKGDSIASLGLSWNFGTVSKLSQSSVVKGS